MLLPAPSSTGTMMSLSSAVGETAAANGVDNGHDFQKYAPHNECNVKDVCLFTARHNA